MNQRPRYDIFVTHAWRYHEPWSQLAARFDADQTRWWRNFSLPWHDPAIEARTDRGRELLLKNLESQIAPVMAALLLVDVFETQSTQKWISEELNIARRRNIPIIGILPQNEKEIGADLRALCSEWVPNDLDVLARTIDLLRA